MARPPGVEAPEGPPAQLPAPYAPPWMRLGEDLLATAAWLRLKIRELLRRNREGDLPLPAFWPRRWSVLFWPLVVLMVILGIGALGWLWLARTADAPAPGPAGVAGEARVPEGSPARREPPAAAREGAASAGQSAPPEAPGELSAEGAPETSEAPPEAPAEPPDSPQPDPAAAEKPSAAEQLLAEWRQVDPERLVAGLTPEPASATLLLQLQPAFTALPLADRQRWAERWQEQAGELGYSHLQLQDLQGRPLGRDAQVGSGMILILPWQEQSPVR